ncbi:YgaP family membrane protein [Ancylomarina longa]|nr:DUF2892 domain-containing protein [Ancylomarina longa]
MNLMKIWIAVVQYMPTELMLKSLFTICKKNSNMRERLIRAIAGCLILVSVLLAFYVNINWLFLTAFVGLNLLQSSITKWCLMEDILRKVFKVDN